MKKLFIAAFALIGYSAASFAQAVPAIKMSTAPKMEVVKKATVIKTVTPAPLTVAKAPIAKQPTSMGTAKPAPVVAKQIILAPTVAKTNTNTANPLKKDGTPDKRFKTNSADTKGPVKKDGTPDMRCKTNKKSN